MREIKISIAEINYNKPISIHVKSSKLTFLKDVHSLDEQ